jgi:hypothetical protein
MHCSTVLREGLRPSIWQDARVPSALGNSDLQQILHPSLMNPPHHLIECRRTFFQDLLLIAWRIGGV